MLKNSILFVAILSVAILGLLSFSSDKFFYDLLHLKQTSLKSQIMAQETSIPTQTGKNLFQIQSKNLTQKVDSELVDLDSQIISCDANIDNLLTSYPSIGGSCTGPGVSLSSIKGKYLGGQCCGVLKDTVSYHKQLEELKKYSVIPDIPLNPYKTPIELAKKWIDYDKAITLSEKEQGIYDQAVSLSEEKGPCCCKCWHYYVNEGIAKKMIKDYGFNAKKVAAFWDTSDICGG